MKSKMIFLNIAIDFNWGKYFYQNFYPFISDSTQAILSSYQNLGLYYSANEDLLIYNQAYPESFMDYLQGICPKIPQPQLKKISSFTLNEGQWLEDLNRTQVSNKSFDQFVFAGISNLEQHILDKFGSRKLFLNNIDYQKLNSKSFLYDNLAKLEILFPKTEFFASFQELAHFSGSKMLKICNSGGSSGIFVVNGDNDPILKRFKSLEKKYEIQIPFLIQEICLFKKNYYITCDTSAKDGEYSVFRLNFYNGISYLHEKIMTDSPEHVKFFTTVSKLSTLLCENGYHGPFGFDGFVDGQDCLFPCIDLNVRIDKTQLIERAKETVVGKTKSGQAWRSLNLTVASDEGGFSKWWQGIRGELNLDAFGYDRSGNLLRPFHIVPLPSPSSGSQNFQVLTLVVPSDKNSSLNKMEEWNRSLFRK